MASNHYLRHCLAHLVQKMTRDDCYDVDEFKSKLNRYQMMVLDEMLSVIPGKWEFSTYSVHEHEGHIGLPAITHYNIIFNDLNDENRCFNMDWDNADKPFEKAHIEVSND